MLATTLDHVPWCHIYLFLELLQGQRLYHLFGQPVPILHHSFCEEIFPNIQPAPPLVQHKPIPLVLLLLPGAEADPTPPSPLPPFRVL